MQLDLVEVAAHIGAGAGARPKDHRAYARERRKLGRLALKRQLPQPRRVTGELRLNDEGQQAFSQMFNDQEDGRQGHADGRKNVSNLERHCFPPKYT